MSTPANTHQHPRLTHTRLPEELFANSEGWPGTPPPRRARRAWEILKEISDTPEDEAESSATAQSLTPQEAHDLEWLVRSMTADQYGPKHLTRMATHSPPTGDQGALRKIIEYARTADTGYTFGAILEIPDTKRGGPTSRLVLAQLVRDRDWTGTSPIFPLVRGLHAAIAESRTRRGLPGTLVISSHPAEEDTEAGQRIPQGPPQDLAHILKWHGATSCHWTTWEKVEDSRLNPGRQKSRPEDA